MKIVIGKSSDGKCRVLRPISSAMRALTHGGLGKLPGDAVTSDLKENTSRRVAVAASMPKARAIENMIRAGRDPDFAARYIDALIGGGETDASALKMITTKDMPDDEDKNAADPDVLPDNRFFRDAWRKVKGRSGVSIDIEMARTIFAKRLLHERGRKITSLQHAVELSILTSKPSEELERQFVALKEMDMKAIAEKIAKAETPEALLMLWPDNMEQ